EDAEDFLVDSIQLEQLLVTRELRPPLGLLAEIVPAAATTLHVRLGAIDDLLSAFGSADARQARQLLDLRTRELRDRAPAELEQRLGHVRIEALAADRLRDLLLRAALELVDLRLRVDVDAPAGELRREADVLALLADRQRELVVGDDQLHAMALGVDDDALDLGGRDRVAHEASRIVVVRHDVDLLAAQLLHDRL